MLDRGRRTALVALLLVGCTASGYPLPAEPPHAGQSNPAAVGVSTRAVLLYIEVRPGDRIELIEAEAIGSLDGATVRFLVSRPVLKPDGDLVIGEDFEDLANAVLVPATEHPGAENTIGIAAELTAQRPGRFEITNVRLRYRLNHSGEMVGEGIDVPWIVCADMEAPADCPEGLPSGQLDTAPGY